MILSIEHQAFVFMASIILGILIGILYDLFRFIRRIIKHSNFATYVEDLLFWILIIFISYVTLLHIANGEIRLYFFIGIFIGYATNYLIISDFIINIYMLIFKGIHNILLIILKPIKLTAKTCYTPTKYIFKKSKKTGYKTKVLLKKTLFYAKIRLRRFKNNIKMIFKKI